VIAALLARTGGATRIACDKAILRKLTEASKPWPRTTVFVSYSFVAVYQNADCLCDFDCCSISGCRILVVRVVKIVQRGSQPILLGRQ